MVHATLGDEDCKIRQYENRIYSHKNEYYAFQSMEYMFPRLLYRDILLLSFSIQSAQLPDCDNLN